MRSVRLVCEHLVFKGTALAYTCYPEPSLRPRLDTDLLIRRADREDGVAGVSSVWDARARSERPASTSRIN